MITKEVAISGAVGKQVYASVKPVVLHGVIANAGSASAVAITVRDGNASGDVILTVGSQKEVSRPFYLSEGIRFDEGMHVKVIGTGGKAYLLIN